MRPRIFIIVSSHILVIVYLLIHLKIRSNDEQLLDCKRLCPYTSKRTPSHLIFDSKYIFRHYPEFICQANFRNLADWVYGWPNQYQEYFEVTTSSGKNIASCLPHGSIIYVSIWSIGHFFNEVYPHLIYDFVLITGEGDLSSPNLAYLERNDSKIIHWFGQNGIINGSTNKKFTHIPIGKFSMIIIIVINLI